MAHHRPENDTLKFNVFSSVNYYNLHVLKLEKVSEVSLEISLH